MPFAGPSAEAGGESVEELRGEGDLGDKNEALPPGVESGGNRLEIDLGLARAGDPFEECDREGAGRGGSRERGGSLLLCRFEALRREARIAGQDCRLGRQENELKRALGNERLDHADRAARGLGKRRLGKGAALSCRRKDAGPR